MSAVSAEDTCWPGINIACKCDGDVASLNITWSARHASSSPAFTGKLLPVPDEG